MPEQTLLWLDLETTGLDPLSDQILEIGAVLTDLNLNILTNFNCVAALETPLRGLPDAVLDMHFANGLFQEATKSYIDSHVAVDKFFDWLVTTTEASPYNQDAIDCGDPDERIVLHGSSVHFDLNFLRAKSGITNKYLHYRVVDVSTLKVLFREYNAEPTGAPVAQKLHRALPDINDTIEEFKFYMQNLDLLYGIIAYAG